MKSGNHSEKEWAEAFIKYGLDAAVGRLFKGIIHNLNGVGQAFSMQTELLQMMFAQTDGALAKLSQADSLEAARDGAAGLREMLAKRASMAKLLTGEVNTLQETMKRVSMLMEESRDPSGVQAYDVRSVIMTEIEFMNSDGFFKHKISKELSLAEKIPVIRSHQVELHQILSELLGNASQALAENVKNEPLPRISVKTSLDDDHVEVHVTDNGPGIKSEDSETVFSPFYTTLEGHLGLGLFLARTIAERCGWFITFTSEPGKTCFTLRVPVGEGGLGG